MTQICYTASTALSQNTFDDADDVSDNLACLEHSDWMFEGSQPCLLPQEDCLNNKAGYSVFVVLVVLLLFYCTLNTF